MKMTGVVLRAVAANIPVVVFGVGWIAASPAAAGGCDTEGATGGDSVTLSIECETPAQGQLIEAAPTSEDAEEPTYVRFLWHSPCVRFDPKNTSPQAPDCGVARTCPNPRERSWQLWGLNSATRIWEYIASDCFGEPPTAADTPRPRVTPALVLNALRRVGLPTLEARTQPEGKTLVNFATIFYTEAEPFTTTLTLLGQQVDVEATPARYTWHHGDGTSVTTSGPGAPYPSKEITHLYSEAEVAVQPSVDVTYAARFRVNGGTWRDIDETVTVAGPQGSLRVAEATAVLAGYE